MLIKTENARISLNVGPMLLFTSASTTNVEDTVSVARGDRSLHTHQVLRVISMETDMFTSSIKCCTNSVEDSGSFTFHISMLVCALFSSQHRHGNRGYVMVSNDGTV